MLLQKTETHHCDFSVKAFINLDNMGNKGKEILYNSCFGSLVLTAYGNEAKYPFANVLVRMTFADSQFINSLPHSNKRVKTYSIWV